MVDSMEIDFDMLTYPWYHTAESLLRLRDGAKSNVTDAPPITMGGASTSRDLTPFRLPRPGWIYILSSSRTSVLFSLYPLFILLILLNDNQSWLTMAACGLFGGRRHREPIQLSTQDHIDIEKAWIAGPAEEEMQDRLTALKREIQESKVDW